MRIHDIQRHLNSIKVESVLPCHFQHVEVDVWIFMPCESDVSKFARLLGFKQCSICTILSKNSIGIFVP